MNPIEKITSTEMDMIRYSINNYAIDSCCGKASVKEILKEWEAHKSCFLYQMFGEELILKKPINYEKSLSNIERDMCSKLFDSSIFSEFYWDMRKAIEEKLKIKDDRWAVSNIADTLHQLANTTYLSKNKFEGYDFSFPLPDGKRLEITAGCKPMKMLGKIAKAYDVTDSYERLRLAHSTVLNDTKASGELCISIHPLDYITMSDNSNYWDSCMSWINDGEYRLGTVEMMNSPIVVVAYMASSAEFYVGNSIWNSKKWRSLYIVDPKMIMTSVKGYPYQNEDLDNFVLDWLVELAETNLGIKTLDKTPYHYYPYYVDEKVGTRQGTVLMEENQKLYFTFNTDNMYNDFGSMDYTSCRVNTELLSTPDRPHKTSDETYFIDYSGPAQCMCCGSINVYFDGTQTLVCEDCDDRIYCGHCGDRVYDSDDIYYVDDCKVCAYCYENETAICPFTEETHFAFNMIEIKVYKDNPKFYQINGFDVKDSQARKMDMPVNKYWNTMYVSKHFIEKLEENESLSKEFFIENPTLIPGIWGSDYYGIYESELTEKAKEYIEDYYCFCYYNETEED